jgi:aspartyl-tRNA(Asn)/glutamyl-tRNA(Gln) amidotransferase subunit C
MSLDKTDVEKIAHLARLAIDEAEVPHYAQDLNNIFNLVEQMSAADTNEIPPMAHPLDAHQRLRADEVTETDQREDFQAIAPKTEAGVYLVPQVIE